ncbi:MAG: response regulator transcription factor [Actinomycetota bacterium]|nr:response regulator transcription factor [Actinomycetota bacterium]
MIRVVLADDQALVRDGFAMILGAQEDIEVVGEASDGAEALALVREHSPDLVLMDIRMPGIDGIEATRRLLDGSGSRTRVLILTTFDLDEYVYEALKAGASGFLLKDVPRAQLVAAVRAVAAGDQLFSPAILRKLIEEFVRHGPREVGVPAALADLTDRELDVLRLVARGQSNAEIAKKLYLSEATVKTHVRHMLQKLGLHDRVHAVVLAYESGLVERGA